MKYVRVLLLMLGISCLLVGCSADTGVSSPPETLELDMTLPESYPKEAGIYKVEWIEMDEDLLIQEFISEESVETVEYAEGTQYLREDNEAFWEYLTIYNGVLKGGFAYSRLDGDANKREDQFEHQELKDRVTKNSKPDLVYQAYGHSEMEAFDAERSLSFISNTEVIDLVYEKMDACGLPELELLQILPRNEELLNRNREIYNQSITSVNEKKEDLLQKGLIDGYVEYEFMDYQFQKEDEDYVLRFRQMIDGIPFTNVVWNRDNTNSTHTEIEIHYSAQYGMEDVRVQQVYEILDDISIASVISPQQAMEAYIEEYKQAIHFELTRITDVELNYVVVEDSKAMYARPAWMISLEREYMTGDGETEEIEYEYATIAVSADTGVILKNAKDMR